MVNIVDLLFDSSNHAKCIAVLHRLAALDEGEIDPALLQIPDQTLRALVKAGAVVLRIKDDRGLSATST
jgi:hypothetical protein